MAYFKRRRGNQVTVYYWDSQIADVRPLSRDETRHLDDKDDEAVRQWIEAWEASQGKSIHRTLRHRLLERDGIAKLHKAHLDEWFTLHPSKSPQTRRYRELRFEGFIAPYFIEKHGLKDLRKWERKTADFPLHLMTLPNCSIRMAKRVCQELDNFGHYLARRHYIPALWLMDAPTVGASEPTPLKAPVLPEEVYAATTTLPPIWALAVLLGYFASLRPSETYALTKADFLAGDVARFQTKTWARLQKMGLGTGLSVSITKANVRTPQDLPKTDYSRGVVNIWDKRAATLIRDIVVGLPDGPVYTHGRHHLNKLYKRIVNKTFWPRAHDLRRASCLYLGRTLQMEPWLLQEHMRHATIQTTLLYTRMPAVAPQTAGRSDFDDVG